MAFRRDASTAALFPVDAITIDRSISIIEVNRAVQLFCESYSTDGWVLTGDVSLVTDKDGSPKGYAIQLRCDWSEFNPGGDHLMTQDVLSEMFTGLIHAFEGHMHGIFNRRVGLAFAHYTKPRLMERTILPEGVEI